MAAQGPLINQSREGLEVKGRRKLEGDASIFGKLLDDITAKMSERDGQAEPFVIADLDISQNKLTYDQFEALFTQLGAHNTRVLRFRMFGCPTLNDEVARVIADYLRLLTQENSPTEMHLSDCAITTEGFNAIVSAIEEGELYPLPPLSANAKPLALYMRLENNYIEEAAIQEKVDAGVIRPFRKQGNNLRPPSDGTAKIDLVVRDLGKYQQRQGEPPAPENAPPPKQVHDKYADQQGQWQKPAGQQQWLAAQGWQNNAWGQQVGWQGQKSSSVAAGAVAWARPAQPRPGFILPGSSAAGVRPGGGTIRPIVGGLRPAAGMVGGPRTVGPRPVIAAVRPAVNKISPGAAGGSAWNRAGAAGGNAADRSRTPGARTATGAKPPHGAPPKQPDLPHPWEEHWSDEYQIPYFWNAETGEALWEKPEA